MSDIVISFDFPPMIGGAHTWLYEVYRRWPSKVSVLTSIPSGSREDLELLRQFDRSDHGMLEVLRIAAPVPVLDLCQPAYLRAVASQVRAIQRIVRIGLDAAVRQPRVYLHALRAFPEGVAGALHKRFHSVSTRLITYAHGEEILVAMSSRQLKFLATKVYSTSDLVIANSRNTARLIEELCPSANVTVIHPGVDVKAFSCSEEDRTTYRKKWKFPEQTVIVSTLGRMEARKNHAALIRATAQVRREGLEVALICGGDGPERGRLIDLSRELGVMEWTRMPGRISAEEKCCYYAASDIFAMPSIQVGAMIEGFGIVFLEAAAAGLPAISGANGGQSEAVLDGKTGLVVDGANLRQLTAALARLTADSNERHQMGREGRVWAESNDWVKVVNSTRDAIREKIAA